MEESPLAALLKRNDQFHETVLAVQTAYSEIQFARDDKELKERILRFSQAVAKCPASYQRKLQTLPFKRPEGESKTWPWTTITPAIEKFYEDFEKNGEGFQILKAYAEESKGLNQLYPAIAQSIVSLIEKEKISPKQLRQRIYLILTSFLQDDFVAAPKFDESACIGALVRALGTSLFTSDEIAEVEAAVADTKKATDVNSSTGRVSVVATFKKVSKMVAGSYSENKALKHYQREDFLGILRMIVGESLKKDNLLIDGDAPLARLWITVLNEKTDDKRRTALLEALDAYDAKAHTFVEKAALCDEEDRGFVLRLDGTLTQAIQEKVRANAQEAAVNPRTSKTGTSKIGGSSGLFSRRNKGPKKPAEISSPVLVKHQEYGFVPAPVPTPAVVAAAEDDPATTVVDPGFDVKFSEFVGYEEKTPTPPPVKDESSYEDEEEEKESVTSEDSGEDASQRQAHIEILRAELDALRMEFGELDKKIKEDGQELPIQEHREIIKLLTAKLPVLKEKEKALEQAESAAAESRPRFGKK